MRLYAEKMEAQRDEIHSRLHSLQVSNFTSRSLGHSLLSFAFKIKNFMYGFRMYKVFVYWPLCMLAIFFPLNANRSHCWRNSYSMCFRHRAWMQGIDWKMSLKKASWQLRNCKQLMMTYTPACMPSRFSAASQIRRFAVCGWWFQISMKNVWLFFTKCSAHSIALESSNGTWAIFCSLFLLQVCIYMCP